MCCHGDETVVTYNSLQLRYSDLTINHHSSVGHFLCEVTRAIQRVSGGPLHKSLFTVKKYQLKSDVWIPSLYIHTANTINKRLANAKRPCDCSVLCLRPKSALCSCSDCILDITSFGSADSVPRASNNGVGQFKPIFQIKGNTSGLYF